MREKLRQILDYLEANTTGKQLVYVQSFAQHFELNGSLSQRQLATLESIVKSHIDLVDRVEQFEMDLNRFFKTAEVKSAMRLVV